jgi:hypothetical protein
MWIFKLHHSPANQRRLNLKIEDWTKVEARTSDQPPTPTSSHLVDAHTPPPYRQCAFTCFPVIIAALVADSYSIQNCNKSPTAPPARAPKRQHRAISGSASTVHTRVASHWAQRLSPTTTAHYRARISIYRIGETSSHIWPPKCSIQSRFWPRPDLWRVFGWLPTWSANSQSKMSCSRTLRTM